MYNTCKWTYLASIVNSIFFSDKTGSLWESLNKNLYVISIDCGNWFNAEGNLIDSTFAVSLIEHPLPRR